VSCYSPTERVRSSSVSSLASCVIVAPAAHSASATRVPSKTPPPPGAAREGPCDKDDFSFHGPPEDLGFEAVEAESAANGNEEFPAQLPSSGPWSVTTCEPLTDTDRPVSYAEHVFQLETLLNEVLEAAEFEYEVVRLDSAGDYEFGKLGRAHLVLEGGQILASVDKVDYDPLQEFISKWQQSTDRPSTWSQGDAPVNSASASEVMCNKMMDPAWTAERPSRFPAVRSPLGGAAEEQTLSPRGNGQVTSSRAKGTRGRAQAPARETSPVPGPAFGTASSSRAAPSIDKTAPASTRRGRSPRKPPVPSAPGAAENGRHASPAPAVLRRGALAAARTGGAVSPG
ncbi:unnamed protein product, partial [Polarella glacialis]